MSRYLSWIDDGALGDLLGRAGARGERASRPERARGGAARSFDAAWATPARPAAAAPVSPPAPAAADSADGEGFEAAGSTLARLARLLDDEHRQGDFKPRPAPMSIRSDEIAQLRVGDAAIPEVQSGRVVALKRPARQAVDGETLWLRDDDLERAMEQGADSDAAAVASPARAPAMAPEPAPAFEAAPQPEPAPAVLRRPSEARSLGDAFARVADHLRALSNAEDVFIADAEGMVLANTGADEPLVATSALLRAAAWRLTPWLGIDGAPLDRLALGLGDGRALALHWVALSEATSVVVGVVLKRSPMDSTQATLHKMLDADFARRWGL